MDVEDFEERNSLGLILDMGGKGVTFFYFPHYLSSTFLPKADNNSDLVPGSLNAVKDLKRTNRIVSFGIS
jgi:hypothetical protein